MKKLFTFVFAAAATMSAFAADATSPYKGSEPVLGGSFYLYQVETGQWLQPNMSDLDWHTTHAELGEIGIDIELRRPNDSFTEGYQIFVNFTNNGELNGSDQDRCFFDQGDRALCEWIFVPVEKEGVQNGYKIMIKAKEGRDRDRIEKDTYLGAIDGGKYGGLAPCERQEVEPTYTTWQLVSREDRLRKMLEDAENGMVDCTWLIPWNDLSKNNKRMDLWNKTVNDPDHGGLGWGGHDGYPVQEYWHEITMRKTITLTGLPQGTYGFAVQAYYRKNIDSEDFYNEWRDGTLEIPVKYFAGSSSASVKCIFDDAPSVKGNGFEREIGYLGLFVPDALDQASLVMYNGNYINDYIQAPVTDGLLTIGIEKEGASWHDWFVEKRYFLRYESNTVEEEDLTDLKNQLTELINEAKGLYQSAALVAAINEAETQLENATTSAPLMEAMEALRNQINVIRGAEGDIKNYLDIVELGFTDAEAQTQFANAQTRDDYAKALRTLRYARRLAVAEKHEDVFTGVASEEIKVGGNYYIYNLGRKQFLQGGGDWGAHAALGFQGCEITFEENVGTSSANTADFEGYNKYILNTHLNNGGSLEYLGYGGYMDSGRDAGEGGWAFIPVEGKENVYYMVQGDYTDVHVQPDVNFGPDECSVNTESRNLDRNNLDAQWKIVTREERVAMLEDAGLSNPVDATFFIQNPGFNQRAAVDKWNGFNLHERGANFYDFVAESWSSGPNAKITQTIEGLPAGVYQLSVQGFYRVTTHTKGQEEFNGNGTKGVANMNPELHAYLFVEGCSDDEQVLPYILDESGNAPGEGDDAVADETSEFTDPGTVFNIPNSVFQAANFFKTGLYKTYTVVEHDGNDMTIGVKKTGEGERGDWVVIDNFRLTYYGDNTTKEAVRDVVSSGVVVGEEIERPQDDRIFNLQGIEVKNATVPGIYIRNGRKFIVK